MRSWLSCPYNKHILMDLLSSLSRGKNSVEAAETQVLLMNDMERQISLNPQNSYRDPSTSSDEDENGNQNQPGDARQAETTKLIRQAKEQTA